VYEVPGNQHSHAGVASATGGVASQYDEPQRQELSAYEVPPTKPELPSTPAQTYAPVIGRKPVSSPPPQSTSPPPWDHSQGGDYATYQPSELGTSTTGSVAPSSSVSNDDLRTMEEEMARIRAQKERLHQLHALEEREEELRRNIEARRGGNGT